MHPTILAWDLGGTLAENGEGAQKTWHALWQALLEMVSERYEDLDSLA